MKLNGSGLSICFLVFALCLSFSVPYSAAEEVRKWPVEFDVGSFRIHSDFELEQRKPLAEELRAIERDVRELLVLKPGKERVHIVLFRSNAEYRRYMENYFPDLPKRRALFLQDRGPGMLFTHWHPDVVTDLRHEMTHALLNQNGRVLPLWLDEGIAEYFEVRRSERFRGNPYSETTKKALEIGGIQSISELSGKKAIHEFADQDYRDSWAWVHFALHRSERTREVLRACLAESPSVPPAELTGRFERGLRNAIPDLEKNFAHHFRSLRSRTAQQ